MCTLYKSKLFCYTFSSSFCLKSPCVLAINLENAASALCLAARLPRRGGGGGMLFGLLVTRTGFRGVYADRLTPFRSGISSSGYSSTRG